MGAQEPHIHIDINIYVLFYLLRDPPGIYLFVFFVFLFVRSAFKKKHKNSLLSFLPGGQSGSLAENMSSSILSISKKDPPL